MTEVKQGKAGLVLKLNECRSQIQENPDSINHPESLSQIVKTPNILFF